MFALLDVEQQKDLLAYIRKREKQGNTSKVPLCAVSECYYLPNGLDQSLTEIQEGNLYLCLEERTVYVKGQKIELTTKEFDALYLLIINKRRVMTFETISYHVWGEDYIDVTTQAIHNLMSRLRQKLQTAPDMPEYIISIRGVGLNLIIKSDGLFWSELKVKCKESEIHIQYNDPN